MDDEMLNVWDNFLKDKFRYRVPGGESYQDLVFRLQPLVVEIERHRSDVLIVGHKSSLQVLYSYFMGAPVAKCDSVEMSRHVVIKLTASRYGWQESRISLD